MKILLILAGIILFFILLLSIGLKVIVHSEGGVDVTVSWLFLKFRILPQDEEKSRKKEEKKKKKEAKKAKKAEKDGKEDKKEKPKDETIKEPKAGKDNMFLKYYRNNGVSGTVELIERLAKVTGTMFRGVARSFTIDEMFISLKVGAGDSADTAIKYGKTCSVFYPAIGLIVDTMRVHKYSVEVKPDFVEGKNEAKLHAKLSLCPRRLINALIAFAFRALFKVGIKFLKGQKAPKPEAAEEQNKKLLKTKGEVK